MINFIRSIIFFLLIVNTSVSQSLNKMIAEADHSSILTLTKGDSIEVIHLYNTERIVKPNLTNHYYWYSHNKVKITQGAYDGRLLNGAYSLFNRSRDYLEKGTFKKGVKSGEWLSWHSNGNIQSVENWKKGRKNGAFLYYYSDGKLRIKGRYKLGSLDGTVTTYNEDGSIVKEKYNKGELKIAKGAKIDKSNAFKKGEKVETEETHKVKGKKIRKEKKQPLIDTTNEQGKEPNKEKKIKRKIKKTSPQPTTIDAIP